MSNPVSRVFARRASHLKACALEPRKLRAASPHSRLSNLCQFNSLSQKNLAFKPPAMGSDEDYAAFLDKANQDVSGGASAQSATKSRPKATNTSVPSSLQKIEAYYTTDADEPFEPVSLKWEGDGIPSASDFSDLIDAKAESISAKEFDPAGQYAELIEAVKKEGCGEVGYFRVALGGTRSEVWVVSANGKGKLVGLRAVAVMS
ncbi:uncharacterized protein PV09_07416 [Verruconis gallopava]|uniref:Uncharacterized protein n=1 Tax=Verruconis gallopava TaxID=253628 RepID=A0A0D2A3V6_9PEZI|nr:uncharacterized protein PV09_07416 [Verruconis gallopava]KIW01130.1 hypothetical protein PV09_07416 [Verruconis gallopava]